MIEFNPHAALALGARLRDHRWGIVLTDLDAEVVRHLETPLSDLSPATAVAALQAGVDQITQGIDRSRLLPAIGLGTPGLVDMAAGVVKTAVDVGWVDVPIRAMAEEALGMGVYVANRSKVGALAELWCGREQNVQNLLYISIGTGIAGVVIQGQLYMGVNSSGRVGPRHHFAGRPAVRLQRRGLPPASLGLGKPKRSPTAPAPNCGAAPKACSWNWPKGTPDRSWPETVFAAAEQGDEAARHVVDDTAIYLGIAIANLVNLFNPALIVLGGPVGQNGQVLLEPLRRCSGAPWPIPSPPPASSTAP